MIGLDRASESDSQLKYHKPRAIGAALLDFPRRLLRAISSGASSRQCDLFCSSEHASGGSTSGGGLTSRLRIMVPWSLCLLLAIVLLYSNRACNVLATQVQSQANELQEYSAILQASNKALEELKAARERVENDLKTSVALADSLQHSLQSNSDASLSVDQAFREKLQALQAAFSKIEEGTKTAQDHLRRRLEEAARLEMEQHTLQISLRDCRAKLASSIEQRSVAGERIQHGLERLQDQMQLADSERQDSARDNGQEQQAPTDDPARTIKYLILQAQKMQTGADVEQTELLDNSGQSAPDSASASSESSDSPSASSSDAPADSSNASSLSSSPASAASSGIALDEFFDAQSLSALAVAIQGILEAAKMSSNRGQTPAKDVFRHRRQLHRPFAPQSDATGTVASRKQWKKLQQLKPKAPLGRHHTPIPPPDPEHPEQQIHFEPWKPLHLQPEHERRKREWKKQEGQEAPFPTEYVYHAPSSLTHLSSSELDVLEKRDAIREEFLHAWNGYKQFAWGFDELHPISKQGRNSQYYMALTMIDALDTLILMGFDAEVKLVRDYLDEFLIFTEQEDINVFETTIRVIGGLLAAYALTGDQMYAAKAEECARGLLIAFQTPTGLPYGTVGLRTRVASNPSWSAGSSTMSEVGSIQMEWQYLTRITGDPIFADKVNAVTDQLKKLNKSLYPQFINVDSGQLASSTYTFGARVDSIYEYFLKQYLLSGQDEQDEKMARVREMYLDSMRAMDKELVKQARPLREGEEPLTYIAELHGSVLTGKMDHLVCFVPGMLALGVMSSVVPAGEERSRHLALARQLTRTCHEMYHSTGTGLAAEITQFSLDMDMNSPDVGMQVDPHAAHHMLRPETMESLFLLHRATGDPLYREWGWQIFQRMRQYCRVEGGAGYSGLRDVRLENRPADRDAEWSNWNDKMESFALAETFKYAYLLFSPDEVLPYDQWIFNTEAHALPVKGKRAGRGREANS